VFLLIGSRGGGPKTNSAQIFDKLNCLNEEIQSLEEKESALDRDLKIMQSNKEILLKEADNSK
jgi:hypothetical protein